MKKESLKHCQICARPIKANTGLIAHHGYQRPGYGWQTASCLGAKFLPYEESRDRIPEVLDVYKETAQTWENNLQEFKTNPPDSLLKRYISPYTGKRMPEYDEKLQRPEGFSSDESLKIEKPSFYTQPYEREFNFQAHDMERNITDIKRTRDWLQERFDNWKGGKS